MRSSVSTYTPTSSVYWTRRQGPRQDHNDSHSFLGILSRGCPCHLRSNHGLHSARFLAVFNGVDPCGAVDVGACPGSPYSLSSSLLLGV